MSAVRYFDDIPHIVRYGMSDSKKETGWIIFFRLGIEFKINVARSDVLHTPFEKKWMELRPLPGNVCRPGWIERHNHLCDCIISQAMDLLVQLAPVREYWTTFQEYLHTPGYVLKMVTDERVGDAIAVVVDGPSHGGGAYELQPMPEDEVGSLPEDLPRISSSLPVVTDKETDWRRPPHQVQVRVSGRDEDEYALKPVEKTRKNVSTGKFVNSSLDNIRAYMALHEHCKGRPDGYPAKIPRPVAIITDEPEPIETDATPDNPPPQTQTLIAGILRTLLPKTRSLQQLLISAKEDPDNLLPVITSLAPKWRSQTLDIISSLHSRGLFCGARDDESWYFVNQAVILVDEGFEVWMDPLIKVVGGRGEVQMKTVEGWILVGPNTREDKGREEQEGEFERGKRMDLKGVVVVFEQWLPGEVRKIEEGRKNEGRNPSGIV